MSFLNDLEDLISQRKSAIPEQSYTARLFKGGIDRILKKIGEEAGEVIIAAKNHDNQELANEAADLMFHLLILLHHEGLSINDVIKILESRNR